jgi:hypothetical protein
LNLLRIKSLLLLFFRKEDSFYCGAAKNMTLPKTIFAALFVAAPAMAQPADDAPLAPIKAFVAALNAGSIPQAEAAMTPAPAITDEFAPFHWQGKGTVNAWMTSDDADAKAHNVTDGVVTIDKPLHLTLAADHGYAVVPMHYAYKEAGKPVTENALFTASLVKVKGKWLMSSWAYALQ